MPQSPPLGASSRAEAEGEASRNAGRFPLCWAGEAGVGLAHLDGPQVDRDFMFALAFSSPCPTFFGPVPRVIGESYYYLMLGVEIQLFTYS